MGFRVGYQSVLSRGEEGIEHGPGMLAGISYERTIIPRWLDLEIAVPVATTFAEETIVGVPVDIHVKKPFRVGPRLSPYLALGPAFDFQLLPEVAVFFGGSFAVGAYFFPSPQVGVDFEFDYNVVAEDGTALHELLLMVGPVVRF